MTIELTPPSSLQMTAVQAQRCDDGRPRKLVSSSWSGSYTITGDSTHVIQHVGSPLLATTSWSASTANNRLTISFPRYSESNPLDTMAYIIYRKR